MRRTVPEIKVEDAMPTNETSMTPIKGVNVTNKVGVVHVMEVCVSQTAVVVVVDNTVPTRKCSSPKATSVTISVPT
jgi:hypothetical protein